MNSALVSHQMLCGRCGSSLIQVLSEPRRAALGDLLDEVLRRITRCALLVR